MSKKKFNKRNPKKSPRTHSSSKNWIYGYHAVTEALKNKNRKFHKIYITDTVKEKIEYAVENLSDFRQITSVVSRRDIDNLFHESVVHQGIAALADSLPDIDFDEFLHEVLQKEKPVIILLDQVEDPHNIGAILRLASVFNAQGIIVPLHGTPDLTASAIKVASGGVEHTSLITVVNIAQTMKKLKDNDFFCIGLDERGENLLYDMPSYEKTVLVLGAEGKGLRRLTREHCDILVKIPVLGEISSLNVSTAAAISLYEIIRK